MEDSELTKKAIEELMREMDEIKEKESIPTERNINPLRRPNKPFLQRTINSMMSHNKRQADRNHQRCQRKLQKMDTKQRRREYRNHHGRYRKSESSHENISSDSADEKQAKKKTKSLKKKKKKRRKKSSSSSSSSFSSSSSSSSSSRSSETDSSSKSNSSPRNRSKNRKKKKHKKPLKDEEYDYENYYDEYYNDPTAMGYYVDPNMAYAAMAYNQMNHIIQQQQMAHQEFVKDELIDSVEIPSDLSLSYRSESSLNISLNSSSAEEDENGVLTFKLDSSEDEGDAKIKKDYKNTTKETKKSETLIELEESDKKSVHSHISLESEGSTKAIDKGKNEEICLLSSSDSEDLEIVETIEKNNAESLEMAKNSKGKTIEDIEDKTNANHKTVEDVEDVLDVHEKSIEVSNSNEKSIDDKEVTLNQNKSVEDKEETQINEESFFEDEVTNNVAKENEEELKNTSDIIAEIVNESVEKQIENVNDIKEAPSNVSTVDLTDD